MTKNCSNKSLNDSKKAYNDLTSLATKLARNQQELGDLSRKDLELIVKKSKARREDIIDNAKGMQEELKTLQEKVSNGEKLDKTEQKRKSSIEALLSAVKSSLELETNITEVQGVAGFNSHFGYRRIV